MVAGLVLLPLGLAIGGVIAQPAFASIGATQSAELDTVTVSPGESLWQIAEAIAVDRDVRDIVLDIRHLNGLESSQVEPGQVLVLPNDR